MLFLFTFLLKALSVKDTGNGKFRKLKPILFMHNSWFLEKDVAKYSKPIHLWIVAALTVLPRAESYFLK